MEVVASFVVRNGTTLVHDTAIFTGTSVFHPCTWLAEEISARVLQVWAADRDSYRRMVNPELNTTINARFSREPRGSRCSGPSRRGADSFNSPDSILCNTVAAELA